MTPMLFHDGVSIPFSTLLVRRAEGAAATAIVDECFGPAASLATSTFVATTDLAIWVGEVGGPHARPLATAVLRCVDGRAVLTAATVIVRTGSAQLTTRLTRGVVEAASSEGCTTIAARADGPGRPGPRELMHRAGLRLIGDLEWSIEP